MNTILIYLTVVKVKTLFLNMLMSDCMTVRPVEVYDTIMMLDINKTCCVYNITAGHLNYGSHSLCLLIAMCFTGFLVYGVLTDL